MERFRYGAHIYSCRRALYTGVAAETETNHAEFDPLFSVHCTKRASKTHYPYTPATEPPYIHPASEPFGEKKAPNEQRRNSYTGLKRNTSSPSIISNVYRRWLSALLITRLVSSGCFQMGMEFTRIYNLPEKAFCEPQRYLLLLPPCLQQDLKTSDILLFFSFSAGSQPTYSDKINTRI